MAEIIKREYLDEVSKNLLCSKPQKKQFIAELSADVDEFIDNCGELSAEILVEEFGSPEEVAASFTGRMKHSELKSKLSNKRTVLLAVIAGIILLVAAIVIGVRCYQRWEFFSHPDGFTVEGPAYVLESDGEVDEFVDAVGDDVDFRKD